LLVNQCGTGSGAIALCHALLLTLVVITLRPVKVVLLPMIALRARFVLLG
jgi:hypothetical protein